MKMLKNVLKNSLSSILLQVITFIFGMILPRLFIKTYGSTMNGLVSSINQIVSYLALLEAGLSIASLQALFKPTNENDWDSINSILSATKKYYRNIAIVFLILTIIISLLYPFFINEKVDYIFTVELVVILAMGNLVNYFFYTTESIFLKSQLKQYVVVFVQLGYIVVSKLIQIILINYNIDLRIVYSVIPIIAIFRSVVLRGYIFFYYEKITYKAVPNYNALSKRSNALIHQISGLIVNNTDIIVLTIFTNLKVVSIYTIYNLLFSAMNQVISMTVTESVFPFFGKIIVDNKNKKILRNSYKLFELIYIVLLTVILCTLSFVLLDFIELYTMGLDVNYVDDTLAVLFICTCFFNNVKMPGVLLINAKGHFKETQNRSILEACINIISSLILVRYLGIYGVLLGTIIAFLYRVFDICIYSNKYILCQSAKCTIKNIFLSASIIIVSLFLSNLFNITLTSWSIWFFASVIIIVLFMIVIIFIFFIFNMDSAQLILYYFKNKKKR